MATKKEMAKVDATELALDVNFDDGSTGFEDADQDSYAIPFLRPIQKNSPEVDEADGKFMEDAKPGQFINTVSQQLFDGKDGVVIVPCAFQRKFLLWAPRGDGGLKGTYDPEEVAEMEHKGELVRDPETNRLYVPLEDGTIDEKKCDRMQDTRNHYCLLVDEENGVAEQVLISLTSTQIKKSKSLMSMLQNVKVKSAGRMRTPPTYTNRIVIQTTPEKNEHGSWHGVKFSRAKEQPFVSEQWVFDIAKEFNEMVRAGEAKVDYAQAEGESSGNNKDDGF